MRLQRSTLHVKLGWYQTTDIQVEESSHSHGFIWLEIATHDIPSYVEPFPCKYIFSLFVLKGVFVCQGKSVIISLTWSASDSISELPGTCGATCKVLTPCTIRLFGKCSCQSGPKFFCWLPQILSSDRKINHGKDSFNSVTTPAKLAPCHPNLRVIKNRREKREGEKKERKKNKKEEKGKKIIERKEEKAEEEEEDEEEKKKKGRRRRTNKEKEQKEKKTLCLSPNLQNRMRKTSFQLFTQIDINMINGRVYRQIKYWKEKRKNDKIFCVLSHKDVISCFMSPYKEWSSM